LLQQARPEDTSWQRALAAELSLWANGADMARSVQAPPTMQAFHQRILASLDLFQQASAQLVSALQAGDQATMQQGLTTAQRAHEAMSAVGAELSRMLDRGGP
jgi:hypothetical protein